MNESAANLATINPDSPAHEILDLRDIHLPDPISWWPIAPGWWMVIACLFLIVILVFVIKKYHASKKLFRDINSELDTIKQQFHDFQDKSQLAKSLSILLRRSCMTYYPGNNIAGLTGNDWLAYLDKTNSGASSSLKFKSDIGTVLTSAPYLQKNSLMEFDEDALVKLCESWLLSKHKPTINKTLVAAES